MSTLTPNSSIGPSIVLSSAPTTATGSSTSDVPSDSSLGSYMTTSTSSIIACLWLMIALMYLVVLSWGYRIARQHEPRPLNKTSGPRVQKYAPVVYVFLVLSSLVEMAFASWLLIQYNFNHNYPREETRHGVGLLLFASIWTLITAGIYSILILHPTWSKRAISSIGAQAVWSFTTWLFWVVGAGIVNGSVPEASDTANCKGVVYCVQLQFLFGFAVIECLVFSAGMLALGWLAWQSTHSP